MEDIISAEAPAVVDAIGVEAPGQSVEMPKYSGLLQCIFADGTIQYDGQIGPPDAFPLTEAELREALNP